LQKSRTKILAQDRDESTGGLVTWMLVSAVVDIILILLSLAEGTEDTAFAFLIMGLIAFVPLMLLRLEAKKPISQPVYFEKELTWWDLVIGFLTGELVLAANIIAVSYDLLSGKFDMVPQNVLPSVAYNSILYVPQFFTIPSTFFNVIINSVSQYVFTAWGEELMKAAAIYGLYRLTKNAPVSIAVAIGTWAGAHTILAGFSLFEVMLAAFSGIAFFFAWALTGNLITAILAHGTYNASITILSATLVPGAGQFILPMVAYNTAMAAAMYVIAWKLSRVSYIRSFGFLGYGQQGSDSSGTTRQHRDFSVRFHRDHSVDSVRNIFNRIAKRGEPSRTSSDLGLTDQSLIGREDPKPVPHQHVLGRNSLRSWFNKHCISQIWSR